MRITVEYSSSSTRTKTACDIAGDNHIQTRMSTLAQG